MEKKIGIQDERRGSVGCRFPSLPRRCDRGGGCDICVTTSRLPHQDSLRQRWAEWKTKREKSVYKGSR